MTIVLRKPETQSTLALPRPKAQWLNFVAPVLFTGIGILLLMLGSAMSWWSVPQYATPHYALLFRIAALACAIAGIAGAVLRTWRCGLLMTAGLIGALLPFLFTLTVIAFDSRSLGVAVEINRSADRLVNMITHTDMNTRTPWLESRTILANIVDNDDYTIIESYETVMFFIKGGWHCCVLGGLFLICASCIWNRRAAHLAFRSASLWIVLGLSLIGVVAFGPILLGHYYWNLGRGANAEADYARALQNYRLAARWDRRMDYDLNFHHELGMLYGHMHMNWEADYWTVVAAGYVRSGRDQLAYETVKAHIPDPSVNPCVRFNYAHILMRRGAADYRNLMPGSAILKWRQALALDPGNLEVKFAIALAETSTRNYDEAINEWRGLIDDVNSINLYTHSFVQDRTYIPMICGRSWQMLSWCYFQTDRYPEAMTAFINGESEGDNKTALVGPGVFHAFEKKSPK